MSFICHIHNYTEYNEEWNVFSAFKPIQVEQWATDIAAPGEQFGFGTLLKGLTSVVDTSCQSRDSYPLPRVSSPIRPRLPLVSTSGCIQVAVLIDKSSILQWIYNEKSMESL